MDFESAERTAKRLGCTVRAVQKWAKDGKIPYAYKDGRDWKIPISAQRPSGDVSPEISNEPLPLVHNYESGGALEYINNNLNSVFSLEDICEHIRVSKYYLCHKFKKIVGMTVGDYVLSRRISVARKYLRGSDITISEVAEKVGFSSFSYFSKIFKQYEGVTPSEFRKTVV